MEYIETESSNIKKVGYDAKNSILEIWFHSGEQYWYFEFKKDDWTNINEIIERGDSIGKYFHKAIRGHFPHLSAINFEQDVEFDAILIHNKNKMGTERNYLKFNQLCEKHGWDFLKTWDKAWYRSLWFDNQPEEYRNEVLGAVGDLCVEEEKMNNKCLTFTCSKYVRPFHSRSDFDDPRRISIPISTIAEIQEDKEGRETIITTRSKFDKVEKIYFVTETYDEIMAKIQKINP